MFKRFANYGGLFLIMFYTGVVEDVNDPLELGRARVRVIGLHNFDEIDIPTDTLPWAVPLMPSTAPSAGGAGVSTRFIPFKSWVMIYFMDPNDKQLPVIMGSLPGVATETTLTINGIEQIYNANSKPSEIWKNQSDLPAQGRSGPVTNPRSRTQVNSDVGSFKQPESRAAESRYPYNQVSQSESGHISEVDDTPGAERVSNFHRSGSGHEIGPSGDYETIVVGDSFKIMHNNENVYIEGVCNVHINNDCNLYVAGNYNVKVKGDYNLHVNGNYKRHVKGTSDKVTVGIETINQSALTQTIDGDNMLFVGGKHNVSNNSYNINTVEKVTFISNSDFVVGTKTNFTLGAENNIQQLSGQKFVLGSENAFVSLSSGTNTTITSGTGMYLSSGTTTNLGGGDAINIGTGSQQLTMNATQINQNNSGTSAPKVQSKLPMQFAIPKIDPIEFDLPIDDFNEPAIVALDPDPNTRKTQNGSVSKEEYQKYVDNTTGKYGSGGSSYTPNVSSSAPVGRNTGGYSGGGSSPSSKIDENLVASDPFKALLDFIASGESSTGKPPPPSGLFIVGDSHANAIGSTQRIQQNKGKDGARLGAIESAAKGIRNSTVVLTGGHNDVAFGRSPDEIAAHVARLIDDLKSRGNEVIYVLYPIGTSNPNQENMAPTRDAIKSAISGVQVIDLEGRPMSTDGQHNQLSVYKDLPIPKDTKNGQQQSDPNYIDGYDAVNHGTGGGSTILGSNLNYKFEGKRLRELTIGKVMELQKKIPGKDRSLFATGRYQIIPDTLRFAVGDAGLTKQDLYNEINQDKLGLTLIMGNKRPPLRDYLLGKHSDIRAATLSFAQEWASLPDPDTGKSFYDLPNRASHTVEEVQTVLRAAREFYIENGTTEGSVDAVRNWTEADKESVETTIKRKKDTGGGGLSEDELTRGERNYARYKGYLDGDIEPIKGTSTNTEGAVTGNVSGTVDGSSISPDYNSLNRLSNQELYDISLGAEQNTDRGLTATAILQVRGQTVGVPGGPERQRKFINRALAIRKLQGK